MSAGTVTMHVMTPGLAVTDIGLTLNHDVVLQANSPVAGFTASASIDLIPGNSYIANCTNVGGGAGFTTPSSFQCVPNTNVDVYFYSTAPPPPPPAGGFPPGSTGAGTVTIHVVDSGVVGAFIGAPNGHAVISVANPAQGFSQTATIYSSIPGFSNSYGAWSVTGFATPGSFGAVAGQNIDVYFYNSPTSPSIPTPTTPPPSGQPVVPPPPPPPPVTDLPTSAIPPKGCGTVTGSGNLAFHIVDGGIASVTAQSYLNGVLAESNSVVTFPTQGSVISFNPLFQVKCYTYGAMCFTSAPGNPPGYCYPPFFDCNPGAQVDVLVKAFPFEGTVTGHILDNGVEVGIVASEVVETNSATLLVKGSAGASGVANTFIESSPYSARCIKASDGTPGFAYPTTFSCIPNGNVDVYFSSTGVFPSGVVLPSGITILEQLTGDQFSAVNSDGTTGMVGLSTAGPVGEPSWPKFCAFSEETGAPPAYQTATPGASGFSYSAPTPTSPTSLIQAVPQGYTAGTFTLRFGVTFGEGQLASGVYTRFFTTWPYNAASEWGLVIWLNPGFTSQPTDTPYVEFTHQWGRMFY